MNKYRYRVLLIVLLLLALSLACSSVSGVAITPTSPPPAVIPTNTPLIPPTEAPTTQAPPPTESPPEDTGEILFVDDFSNSNSGWDTLNDSEIGSINYNNGKYEISVFAPLKFLWANPYQNYTDVIVDVQVEKVTANDEVQMGIICRHQDVNNWYVLVISGDGFAAIRKRFQGNSNLETITEWVDAPVVNRGAAINMLRAECVGTRLALYVNGQLVVEANDSDIPAGDVGLLAGTFENADYLDILFDDFIVRSP